MVNRADRALNEHHVHVHARESCRSDMKTLPSRHVSGIITAATEVGLMTLAQVRSKTERIRGFSALPFLLVAAVSAAGVLFRPAPQTVTGGPINPGDVAWMLTATGLVLLMTPGLSFFYGGMVHSKNVVSTMLQSFVAMAVISIL